jgi:hypothetical protein
VLVSDSLMLPVGPDWDRFLIRVPERSIGELDTILEPYMAESADRGRLAREAYEQWFSPPVVFNSVIAACERELDARRVPERWIHSLWPCLLWQWRIQGELRGLAKRVVLAGFRLIGKKFIYEVNER